MAKKLAVIKHSELTPEELAKRETELAAQRASAMVLFTSPAELDVKKLQRRHTPQLIKPDMVPIGSAVSGTIIDVIPSPSTTVKGNLLWIRHESGQEFTFPVTGVIRNALAPGQAREGKELMEVLRKEIGKTIVCKRLANKPSKIDDGTGTGNKKLMFMFDVFTSNK